VFNLEHLLALTLHHNRDLERHTDAGRGDGRRVADTTVGVRRAAENLQSELEPEHWGLGRTGNRIAVAHI
jgi:hypothetical protein